MDLFKSRQPEGPSWEDVGMIWSGMTSQTAMRVPRWVFDEALRIGGPDLSGFSEAGQKGRYFELKGNRYRYRLVPSYPYPTINVNVYRRRRRRTQSGSPGRIKGRRRATALVVDDGTVLLLKYRGSEQYALPGRRMRRNESAPSAVMRELRERTGLHVHSPRWLFEHQGQTTNHQVVRVQSQGQVRLRSKKLDAYEWWDGGSSIPVEPHVPAIVDRFLEAARD